MALPLLMGALGIGASLWGAHRGAQGARRAEGTMREMYGDAQRRYAASQGQSQQSREEYRRQIEGFDPEAYFNRALSGDISQINENFRNQTGQRMASLNARGLLRSDIGGAAQNQDYNERLARAVSQRSMDAANLQQQKVGMYGQLFGADQGQSNALMNAMYGMGSGIAGMQQGRGDAWAQALGGIGGGLMGMGGSMMQHGGKNLMSWNPSNWFRG